MKAHIPALGPFWSVAKFNDGSNGGVLGIEIMGIQECILGKELLFHADLSAPDLSDLPHLFLVMRFAASPLPHSPH